MSRKFGTLLGLVLCFGALLGACNSDGSAESADQQEIHSVALAQQKDDGPIDTEHGRFKCVSDCIDACCDGHEPCDVLEDSVMSCAVLCLNTFCKDLDTAQLPTAGQVTPPSNANPTSPTATTPKNAAVTPGKVFKASK